MCDPHIVFTSYNVWPTHLFNQNQTNSWLYSEPQPATAVAYIKQGRVYNISNINSNSPVQGRPTGTSNQFTGLSQYY